MCLACDPVEWEVAENPLCGKGHYLRLKKNHLDCFSGVTLYSFVEEGGQRKPKYSRAILGAVYQALGLPPR